MALPLVLTALCTTFASIKMLNGISDAVDSQEAQRSWQAVNSAFSSANRQIAAIVADNARWDDAVEKMDGSVDRAWASETWGVTTADMNYDSAFVVSPEGEVLVAYQNGEETTIQPSAYYGVSFRRLLSETPADGQTFKVVHTLAWATSGLVSVAAAPIVPTTEGFLKQRVHANRLILSRTIGKSELAELGRQYIVEELVVHPRGMSPPGAKAIFDSWGNLVATVSWHPQSPGDAARSSYVSLAFGSVIAMILVLLPISLAHAKSIGRLQNNERRERDAARIDSLSGLPNRLHLSEELKQQIGKSKRCEIALLFIDLDGFKVVNDAYDHDIGDRLIRAVAAGLKVLTSNEGLLARLGGDEFAILLHGGDVRQRAERLASRILAFMKEPFEIDGRVATIGASIGIAENNIERPDPIELMRRADIAMYDAKGRGGNRYRHFSTSLDVRRHENLQIAAELQDHIKSCSLGVAYQPIVDASSFKIVGVEALARWPLDSGKSVAPDRFIGVAEEFGLIGSLSAVLLRKACNEVKPLKDLKLSVNVSPLQINDARFLPELLRILDDCCFPHSQLEIELTEGVLLKNPGRAKRVLRELQLAGINVALDDFGAGYASIGYLRDFEFNKVKLDRSLTQAVGRNVAIQKIVQGTVLVASGLSAAVVAEGVETGEQARLMRLAGCSQLQGYYFGRPDTTLPKLVETMSAMPHPQERAS